MDPDEDPGDLIGLVRAVHPGRRRHQYTVGRPPEGTLVGELGSLHRTPRPGSVPVWLVGDSALVTERHTATPGGFSLRGSARWALSPLAWRDAARAPRLAAQTLRRIGQATMGLVGRRSGRPAAPAGTPVGYLYGAGGLGRVALYAAMRPVTGDQLLTPWPMEAAKLGYGDVVLLGHLSARAPLTGRPLASWLRSVPLPWAWRFGRPAEGFRAAALEGDG